MIEIMNLTAGLPDPYSKGVMDTRSRTLTAPRGQVCTTRIVLLALLITPFNMTGMM